MSEYSCGKVTYATRGEAMAAIHRTANNRKRKSDKGRPGKSYYCEGCGGWHWGHSRTLLKGWRNRSR